ncbi:ArdC family protein [Brevundimonas albigilva]|uniref:ArdC-like ssDNA-binding domain-containing protein n=1 Tax=Brevundimonas albigilva TaxID=1312364 RepID=UPI00201B6394|nr:ArdC family protein [Brevundimonas albigilva]UQV19876.1 ArdC family protein [Brevundimonas albigilva]
MSRPSPSARPDPHAEITALILADLDAGVRPWTRPWSTGGAVSRPLRHDGRPYHGVNVLTLWAQAGRRGYRRPHWMTFRQALALGGAVRKGERGVSVVYAATLARPGEADADAAPGADRADDAPAPDGFSSATPSSTSTRSTDWRNATPARSSGLRSNGLLRPTPGSPRPERKSAPAATSPATVSTQTRCTCPTSTPLPTPRPIMRCWPMN